MVSCMLRPPELVGPRVKCSIRTGVGGAACGDEIFIAATPLAGDVKSAPACPLLGPVGEAVGAA